MLDDKGFQKGYLIIQILTLVLVGAFIIPFAGNIFEDYTKLPQFPIWVIEIFFAILTIIIVVVSFKLQRISNNNLKIFHLVLTFANVAAFLIQVSFTIVRMSGN